MQVIIYQNDLGGVAIVYPTNTDLAKYGIDAIAKKDVPAGKPYKILPITDFPLDGTFNEFGIPNIDTTYRDAWTVDEALLTDGVGGESNEYQQEAA